MMVIAAQRSLVSCAAVSYVVKHFCLISVGFCEHVAGIVPEGGGMRGTIIDPRQ